MGRRNNKKKKSFFIQKVPLVILLPQFTSYVKDGNKKIIFNIFYIDSCKTLRINSKHILLIAIIKINKIKFHNNWDFSPSTS